ncbi:MAG: hypothetical protein ACI4J0_05390, partial [Huintestinicola sp.]|uniref:hypothetical protein n=1 Tax=Huintestinicola sp. TaxID=2981661 RepID=UPI003F0574E5
KVIVKVSSTFSKVAGVKGTASPCRRPQTAKSPLSSKNGARGEKCDSISRGGGHDRLPFLQVLGNLPSKTFRWNVFDKAISVWVCAYYIIVVPFSTD